MSYDYPGASYDYSDCPGASLENCFSCNHSYSCGEKAVCDGGCGACPVFECENNFNSSSNVEMVSCPKCGNAYSAGSEEAAPISELGACHSCIMSTPEVECPFEGCDGTIDPDYDTCRVCGRSFEDYAESQEKPWWRFW